MAYDSTVVLDRDYSQEPKRSRAVSANDRLGGRLNALGVEFHWQARALQGMWFVSVASAVSGSRSRLTQDDPIDFALQLAKQLARQTPASGKKSEEARESGMTGAGRIDPAKTYILDETHNTRCKTLEELAEIALRQTEESRGKPAEGLTDAPRRSGSRRRS